MVDTPKQRVSWLESFPPDIWACFACYLSGEQLGRLKMTGATVLWQRLKSPTVVKSINIGLDIIAFKSLPRFLNDFPSLEELSIHSCIDRWNLDRGLILDSIPSGVRKLELSGRSTGKLLGVTNTTKLNEHLPHLEVLDLRQPYFQSHSWMTHSPQSLTTLRLYGWDVTVELPSSLIHFEADCISLSMRTFVSKLPPSLESLRAECSLHGVELIVPLLPPSSRTLYLGDETDYDLPICPPSILEQLPKSLTCLTVAKYSRLNFGIHSELVLLLPSTLTELSILQSLPWSSWPLLPKSLTKLSLVTLALCTVASKIIGNEVLREVKSIPFDYLPKSITNLELRISYRGKCFCGPPELKHLYFPSQLVRLVISGIQLSPEAAKLLPSLSYLQIGHLCERVCEHIPRGLKTLSASNALMSSNLINHLPNHLTDLHLSAFAGYWFDYNTGEEILSSSNLTEDSIHGENPSKSYDWQDSSLLPPTLIKLRLEDFEELGDSFMLHQQLPNLLELNLKSSQQISDLSIPLLSPHITALNLDQSSIVSGKSFQFLPRCLNGLIMNSSKSIFDSDIQHLPRTLKHAFLNSAVHLTDACIPDLPPRLEILWLTHNTLITPACFPHIPYPLRYSQEYKPVLLAYWYIDGGVVGHEYPC